MLPLPLVRGVMRWLVRPVCGPPVPIWVQRRLGDLMAAGQTMPRGVTVCDVVLGGRPARRYAPAGTLADSAILWIHGGAFVTGSYATHGSFAAHLSLASGSAVYLLDYRLAPEHSHPAALDDVLAALAWVPESLVVLGGDSAGGFLALLAAQRHSREIAGLALVSPMVDPTMELAKAWTGKDPLIRVAWGERGIAAMFGDSPPALGDLTGLPPMVVHVAEHERLRPECEQLAQRSGATLVMVDDGWHDIHLQAGVVRRGAQATEQLGLWIRTVLVR